MYSEVSRLLEILAQRSLLSERKLARLRHQLEEKDALGKSVPLDSLAKLLVHKGHLTQRQANSLVNEITEELQYEGIDEDDDLVLRPIEEDGPAEETREMAAGPPAREEFRAEAQHFEEDQELGELEAAEAAKPAKKRRDWGTGDTSSHASSDTSRKAAASPMEDLPFSTDVPAGRPVRRRKKSSARSEWESPLLLLGGGGLLLLLLVGVLVWYLLRTDTGDAQLRAARQAYADGAYARAVELYEHFVDSYADHDEASSARVHLGLARIRRSLESGASPQVLLEQAQSEIARIEREAAFSEAGRELSAILPEIAEGLADQASAADAPETAAAFSARTQEALALLTNTKYVPKSIRPTESIEDVQRTLASVERRQARKEALSKGLEAMQEARQDRQFQEAYTIYGELIHAYPDVSDLPEVRASLAAIADAEAAALSFHEETRPASTEERDTAGTETILLSTPLQPAAGDRRGEATAFVRIEGAAYGLDAASGELLWRRYVGYADLLPLPTGDGDVLVMDVEQGEFLRLEGTSGELVWRQSVGDVAGNGVLHEDRILVPTADSRLLRISLATGAVEGFVQFAQPIATTPTVDAESNRVVIAGEQSILYVLSADGLRSEDAVFLGHAAGSIQVPAVAVGDTLCVAENFAESRSRLHVFTTGGVKDADEGASSEFQSRIEPVRLTGRVTTPIEVSERRVAVATDLGEIRVFNVATVADGAPISPVATRDAGADASSDHYLTLRGSDLWMAGTRLMRLKILSTGGRLRVEDLPRVYAGDAFVHPLLMMGDRLIHVRRPQGMAGNLLAATDTQSGEQLWERELAAPPTDVSVLPGDAGIAVATASGRLYVVDAPHVSGGGKGTRTIASRHSVAGGIAAIAAGEKHLVVKAIQQGAKLHAIAVPEARRAAHEVEVPGEVVASPTMFGDGTLVPLHVGQVLWVDPDSGQELARPFQPPIRLSRLPEWTSAAVVEPGRSFAVGDRRGRVYLVEVARQDQPARLHMAAQSPPVPVKIAGELCATPSVVLAAAGNRLLSFRLPELTLDPAVELDAPIVWGPFRAGAGVCFTTADNRLYCLDREGRRVAAGSLSALAVGRPLALDDGRLLIALEDGHVVQVDAETGRTHPYSSFGQPLATGPVFVNGRLGAVSADGALVLQPQDRRAALAAARRDP